MTIEPKTSNLSLITLIAHTGPPAVRAAVIASVAAIESEVV